MQSEEEAEKTKPNQTIFFQNELSLSQSVDVNFDDLKGEMKSA